MEKITSNDVLSSFETMKETCPFCSQTDCYGDCDGAKADADEDGLQDKTHINDRRTFNAIIDGIHSLVLAHVSAGIDVTSDQYQKGLETAFDAIQNNYGV